MKRPGLDIPGELIEDFTARATVLADMYRELSDPMTATSVIAALILRDPKAHAGFLDRLNPDRWPLGRPDLCLRIADYVTREFGRLPQDVPVWVFRDNLTFEEWLKVYRISREMTRLGHDTSTRSAQVFRLKNGVDSMGIRSIVPDGAYQDALKAAAKDPLRPVVFLEEAFERVQETFEKLLPTGGIIELCLPR